jgi:hydrogenase expression/formation protein HypD
MGRIDDGLAVAKSSNVIFVAFGDMMRVPGTHGSPFEHKAKGLDVRIVYSPADALQLAKKNPEKHVMFFAIGFETTAPSTALTLMRAKSEDVRNFSVFCNHVTIIPAIRAILDSPDMRLDGFIGPGHVSTVIGCRPYEWIARTEGKPVVTSGFEPLDLLQSIVMLLRQLRAGEARVENQYKRVVPWEGNTAALRAMAEVFQLRPYFEWRGLGFISQSALKIRNEYSEWDAEQRFPIPGTRVTDPKAAQCGEVLKGVLKPAQCKLFGKECTPERPVGALMVSTEGSCAAYYNYEHRKAAALVASVSSVA